MEVIYAHGGSISSVTATGENVFDTSNLKVTLTVGNVRRLLGEASASPALRGAGATAGAGAGVAEEPETVARHPEYGTRTIRRLEHCASNSVVNEG